MQLLLDLRLPGVQIEKELLMESMLLSLDSPEHSFGHILKIEHLLGHHVLSHFHFEMILSAVVTYLAGMLGTSTH